MVAFQNLPRNTESPEIAAGFSHADRVSALPDTSSEAEFGTDR